MAYDENDPGVIKTIKVASVGVEGNRYKLMTTGGESYSFFESKKDGSQTAALRSYRELKVTTGSVVEIWYKESEGPSRTGGVITYRNIISFKPPMTDPDETPTPRQAPAKKPAGNGQQSSVRTIVVDEARLEAEIIGKTATQFMAAAISAGLSLDKAQAEVDKAVMLAERLVNASRGPRRRLPDSLTVPWEAEDALQKAREADDSDIDFP